MKYINAEDLRKAMYEETFEKDSEMQKWESGCWIRYKLFENVLDAMPSADVKEVKHGHWYIDEGCAFCSNCRNSFKRQIMRHCNYCPMCGADMRGETE